MTKSFLTIAGAAAYLYFVTILYQIGYNDYFNIPSAFVEVSLRDNSIFLYSLILALESLPRHIGWWWLAVGPIVTVIVFLHIKGVKFFSYLSLIIIVALFGLGAFNLGVKVAADRSNFLVLSQGCTQVGPDVRYVVPAIYEGKAIFVPVDAENNLGKGFLIKDISTLGCKLEYQETGKVKK